MVKNNIFCKYSTGLWPKKESISIFRKIIIFFFWFGIDGWLVQVPPTMLCSWARYFILCLKNWFNPGRQEKIPIWLKNCWLGHKASTQTKLWFVRLIMRFYLEDQNSKSSIFKDKLKTRPRLIDWLILLLYVPSQQLWSLRDGQFT